MRTSLRLASAAPLLAFVLATSAAPAPPRPRPAGVDLVVARDGSGDFGTVQAALDALPAGAARTRVVLVRNGVYREKLFVTKSRVAIVGEDREKTRIEYAELRREWRAVHPDDQGAAVVNVGDDVTDLVLANLTIRNDYGAKSGERDHQFAIRSGGSSTRIVLLHANVVADGGDTVSLWNAFTGMSYHASCTFEGWVDFVCPRGSSFVTNSRFVAHSPTAAIWHDGSKDRDHRFVVRSSRFDGEPGFPLGRNNRDGQFYLLDCAFSPNMADRPIYLPSAPETYAWEPRVFFHGCHGEDGDRAWFADNLRDADFSPAPVEITPEWTFCGQWDPEGTMSAVLPFVAVPRPRDQARDVPLFGARLRWVPARGATAHELFLGATSAPPLVARLRGESFDTGPLAPATAYFWRVDAITPQGRVPGETWRFTTAGRPMKIVLAGDSTVTDGQGWGRGFAARLLPGAECVNLSRGGRSTKSYLEEGLWEKVLAERPDVVLIQFGHNDAPGKGPDRETDARTTYRENLARMVDEARSAGAAPVIVTSLTRRYLDEIGCIRSDLGDYVEGAISVARERRVPLVDLHAKSIELLERMNALEVVALGIPKPDGTLDRTHLSPAGSVLFGALVADELAKAVPRLAPGLESGGVGLPHPAPQAPPAASAPSGPTTASAASTSPAGAISSLRGLLDRPEPFFATGEAVRIAEQLLFFQRANGGWPKNLDMVSPLGERERQDLARHRDESDTTIDNGATVTQMRFLARVATVTGQERFRSSFLSGLDFLLAAQLPGGGWPQFFPLRRDYSRHATFNDGAMTGVMSLLRDVARRAYAYALVDEGRRARASAAFDNGLRFVLASQVVVSGRRMAWCAQHDAVTFEPRGARTFEPASLSGAESADVVELLMAVDAPSREVVKAVDAAVEWFRAVAIRGLRVERLERPGSPGGVDVVAVPDPNAPPVWARFYGIGTNRPLFVGRDGVPRERLDQIERERRTGYAWYGTWPERILAKDYPAWKARLTSEAP
jgi:PelA/Pel-15E family pectate lyase